VTRYLEPLAIAANGVQESFCRMDQVLLTFGFLVMKYRDKKMNQDIIGRDAIIKSIEMRWSKSDQEVFISAVLVNQFYRTTPFASLLVFSKAYIRVLFTKLYGRFFSDQPPTEFIEHTYDFLDEKGIFQGLEDQVKFELETALNKVRSKFTDLFMTKTGIFRSSNQILLLSLTHIRYLVTHRIHLCFSPLHASYSLFLPTPHHARGYSVFSEMF